MTSLPIRWIVACLAPCLIAGATITLQSTADPSQSEADSTLRESGQAEEQTVKLQYLEIVTPAVEETCEVLAKAHGVTFGQPVAELGNARTADLASGGRLGVRAPMHAAEQPVVRPYVLVENIQSAVKAAEAAGATIAMPPTEIPGQGTFSIYLLGGIEHGLWQL